MSDGTRLFEIYSQQTTIEGRAAACQGFVTHLRTLLKDGIPHHEPLVDVVPLSHLMHVSTDCGAIVMLAFDHLVSRFVVLKTYLHEEGAWVLPTHVLRQLQTSIKFHTYAENPLCLQPCLDVEITKNATNMVFPFYPLTFDALFGPNRKPPAAFVREKTIELLHSVRLLHDVDIAHRDIKGANICFDERGHLVLIDFDSSVTECLAERKTVPVCTLETRAPEQLNMELQQQINVSYNAKAGDWWAVGCVVAQMFLGAPLFRVRDANWQLKDYYEDMCTFCAHLANYAESPHNIVKALRRCITPDILILLCGLLNLDITKRKSAVDTFLTINIA